LGFLQKCFSRIERVMEHAINTRVMQYPGNLEGKCFPSVDFRNVDRHARRIRYYWQPYRFPTRHHGRQFGNRKTIFQTTVSEYRVKRIRRDHGVVRVVTSRRTRVDFIQGFDRFPTSVIGRTLLTIRSFVGKPKINGFRFHI